jgi:hypothetical protein
MKRLLFVAAIVAALAIPAFAHAARSSHFQGAVKDGETVTFTVGKQHHHPVVRAFSWNDVPVTCQPPETVTTSTYTFTHSIRFRHAHFHGFDVAGPGAAMDVSGTFTHHGHRAEGTLEINGDTFEGNGCTSGKLEWHARRVPQH